MSDSKICRRTIICLASVGMILSGFIMLLWSAHRIDLIQVHQKFVVMVYNVALSFFMIGLSIVFIVIKNRIGAFITAAAACFLSFLVLSQFVFQVNLGIDQFFVKAYNITSNIYPGRMAPNTTISFIVMSGTIMFLSIWTARFSLLLLSLNIAVMCQSFISLWGYFFNVSKAYQWFGLTPMAPTTASLFLWYGFALCAVILCQRKS